jgi:2-amino-4-hydroxy-6-hydroxymethyldihydropteridine diphosphokinase
MKEAIVLLGSNLGDKLQKLKQAAWLIGEYAGKVTRLSSIYESEPWGFKDNNKFLNQVIVIETGLTPENLLKILQKIEEDLGRIRDEDIEGYSSRIIDIDILFYQQEIIQTEKLTIPHKLLHLRKFTLVPLNEIAGNMMHPVFQKSISQLLEECPDISAVHKIAYQP